MCIYVYVVTLMYVYLTCIFLLININMVMLSRMYRDIAYEYVAYVHKMNCTNTSYFC